MTAPTLPIRVDVSGLAQLQGVLAALRQMDGMKIQGDPLKEMREGLAKDAIAVKAGLEKIDKHFEDLEVRAAGRGQKAVDAATEESRRKLEAQKYYARNRAKIVDESNSELVRLERQAVEGTQKIEKDQTKAIKAELKERGQERLAQVRANEKEVLGAAARDAQAGKARVAASQKFASDTVAAETASEKLRSAAWDAIDKDKRAKVAAAFAQAEAAQASHGKAITSAMWKQKSETDAAVKAGLDQTAALQIRGHEAELDRLRKANLVAVGLELDKARDLKFLFEKQVADKLEAEAKKVAIDRASVASATAAARATGVPFTTLTGTVVNSSVLREMQAAGAPLAATLAPIPKAVKDIGDAKAAASPKIKAFAADLNDAHAGARGLASGFGALWLTYGRVVPLLAGAAISAGFVQTIKVGAQVQNTFETIRLLSEESATAVAGLSSQMLELARSGPFGPLAIAEAMKTLSLAGLNAKEVSESIRPVLQFSVAGDTSIKTSAEVLSTVATAFKLTANDYGYVGDVIAKTAAISKASVESISGAFKTATVVNSLFGVSLEDLGVGIAVLANVGVTGSAAGTALRNFYTDILGRTPKVAAELDRLAKLIDVDSIAMDKATGKAKSYIEIISNLNTALSKLTPEAQTKTLQLLTTERGGKEAIAGLDAFRQKAKDANLDADTLLKELSNKIKDASGFVAQAAIEMSLTPLNQLKSVKSAMEATFSEVFAALQPQVVEFSTQLKAIFGSEEFRSGLARLTVGLGEVVLGFANNLGVIASFAAGLAAVKVALGIETALAAVAVRATAVAVAMGGAGAATGFFATAATGVLGFLSKLTLPLTLAWGAWELYSFWTGKAADSAKGMYDPQKTVIESLREEVKRIQDVNAAKLQGLTLDEYKRLQDGKKAIGTPGTELVNVAAAYDAAVAKAKKADGLAHEQENPLGKNGLTSVAKFESKAAWQEVETSRQALSDARRRGEVNAGEIIDLSAKIKADAEEKAKDAKARIAANRFGISGAEGSAVAPDKGAAAAAKREANALLAAKSAYEDLIDKIQDKLRLADKEIETSAKVTEVMRFELEMRDKIGDAGQKYNRNKLTGMSPDQAGEALAILNMAVARLRDVEAQRASNKAALDAGEAQVKYLQSLEKTTEKLREDTAGEKLRTSQLGLSKEAVAALEATEIERGAVTLELLAIKKLDKNEDIATYNLLMDQAAAVRDLAAAKKEGGRKATEIEKAKDIAEANKKAAEEVAKTWSDTSKGISDSLSNVFVDWVSNGKSLMEGLQGWMRETFNNLILKPTFQLGTDVLRSSLGLGGPGGGIDSIFNSAKSFGGLFSSATAYGTLTGGATGAGSQAAMLAAQTGEFGVAGYSATASAAGATGAAGFSAAMPYVAGAIAAYSIAKSLGIFGSDTEKEYAKGMRLSAGAGGVSGSSYSKWSRAGGLFNPGSSGENVQALGTDQAAALSASFGTLRTNAIAFADVLGLGSDSIKSFSKDIDIVLGNDQAANEKAITAAMAGLGTDLAQLVLGTTTRTSKTVSVAGPDVWIGSAMDGSGYQTTLEKVVEEVTYTASEWARAGETANDTLTRLGGSMIAVNGAFDLLHHSLRLTGLAGADAASKLVDAFGGIEAFGTKTAAYYDKFYSSEEKLANQRRTVNAELVRLTGGTVSTRAELRRLIEQQNLSTDSGRNMYANLINVSGAFDAMTSASEQAASAMTSLTDSLFDEVHRIRGLIAGPGQQGYAYAQSQFAIKTAQARSGDQDAAKLLPSLSQNLLELAASNVSTLVELRRIQAGTAASLTATGQALGGIPSFDVGTDFVPRDMLAYVHKGEKIVPASQNNDSAVVVEVRALRQEVASLLRQAVDNTKDTTDILQGATRGGLPLQTVAV